MLVDAGYSLAAAGIAKRLAGHTVTAHAVTHAHADHAGGSKRVCADLGVPLWAPAGDVEALKRGWPDPPPHTGALGKLLARPNGWPAVTPDRELREGDEVGGFKVLDTPGHTPGHIALWRESDRVLIAGDVWFNMNFLTLRSGLTRPFGFATYDRDRNRESMRLLAELRPAVTCFGHGPVLRDPAKLRVL